MKTIKNLPLPLSGVALASFALANLYKVSSTGAYNAFSWIGIILLGLMTLKILMNPTGFLMDLKHPVLSSVAPTYSMAMMLMAVYLKADLGQVSQYIWYAAIIIHLCFMINYTFKFVFKGELAKIFPSIFVVYVGIAVASVTGPAFNSDIGQYAFYFALVAYALTLPLVVLRLRKHWPLPLPGQPTLAIMAAPASLLLAGYLSVFSSPNKLLVYILVTISLAMYALVAIAMIKLLRLKFTPAYAAFTFPLVISAVALKKASVFLNQDMLSQISQVQLYIATFIVVYVLSRFCMFLMPNRVRSTVQ